MSSSTRHRDPYGPHVPAAVSASPSSMAYHARGGVLGAPSIPVPGVTTLSPSQTTGRYSYDRFSSDLGGSPHASAGVFPLTQAASSEVLINSPTNRGLHGSTLLAVPRHPAVPVIPTTSVSFGILAPSDRSVPAFQSPRVDLSTLDTDSLEILIQELHHRRSMAQFPSSSPAMDGIPPAQELRTTPPPLSFSPGHYSPRLQETIMRGEPGAGSGPIAPFSPLFAGQDPVALTRGGGHSSSPLRGGTSVSSSHSPVVDGVRNLATQFAGLGTSSKFPRLRASPAVSPFRGLAATPLSKPLDFYKLSERYAGSLKHAGLVISGSTSIPDLFQAYRHIMPIIKSDAMRHITVGEQVDWIFKSVGELVPHTMWSTFLLRAKVELLAVASADELIAVLGTYLFKIDSSPAAAKQLFDQFQLPLSDQLTFGASLQLDRSSQAFLSPSTFVDGCIKMLGLFSSNISHEVLTYWRVGEGASFLASLGPGAHVFNEDSLMSVGIHMLDYLEKVQRLVQLLPVQPPAAPPTKIGVGAFNTRPCLNCRDTSHRWKECPEALRADFPVCTLPACVQRGSQVGHVLSRCFLNKTDKVSSGASTAPKRGNSNDGSQSPSKKFRGDTATGTREQASSVTFLEQNSEMDVEEPASI